MSPCNNFTMTLTSHSLSLTLFTLHNVIFTIILFRKHAQKRNYAYARVGGIDIKQVKKKKQQQSECMFVRVCLWILNAATVTGHNRFFIGVLLAGSGRIAVSFSQWHISLMNLAQQQHRNSNSKRKALSWQLKLQPTMAMRIKVNVLQTRPTITPLP